MSVSACASISFRHSAHKNGHWPLQCVIPQRTKTPPAIIFRYSRISRIESHRYGICVICLTILRTSFSRKITAGNCMRRENQENPSLINLLIAIRWNQEHFQPRFIGIEAFGVEMCSDVNV